MMNAKITIARYALTIGFGCLLGSGVSAGGTQESAAGRTVRLSGFEMYFEERGSGEPLLLLHGFGGCGRDWQPLVSRFATEYRVIVPDLRGHGRSTNPAGAFTHRQAAADVFSLLDQLGVRRFRALGISTGGMTLLHMATSQRERVEAMVLIGATSHFPEEARAIMRQTTTPDTLPAEVRQHQTRCASRGDQQVRELVNQFHNFKDSYDDMNFTAPFLGTIAARTLIVHGDRDQFFPVAIPVEMYRAIPRAALWIVPGGGHAPIFGPRDDVFQDIVLEFLRSRRTDG